MTWVDELEDRPELKQKYEAIIKFIVEGMCPSPLILQRKFKITFKLACEMMDKARVDG